jgi:hypothetical protein
MKEPMNTDIIKSMDKIPVTKNTVPFEAEALKKINFHESDVLLIDLSELVNMSPTDISNYEKLATDIFLEKLKVNIDSNVVVDITASPHELACLFLMTIRSMPSQ